MATNIPSKKKKLSSFSSYIISAHKQKTDTFRNFKDEKKLGSAHIKIW